MTFIPTITQNQVGTTMITGTLDDKSIELVAKLRLNCCLRILDKMDDKESPEGMVFAAIVMEAETILQALRRCG